MMQNERGWLWRIGLASALGALIATGALAEDGVVPEEGGETEEGTGGEFPGGSEDPVIVDDEGYEYVVDPMDPSLIEELFVDPGAEGEGEIVEGEIGIEVVYEGEVTEDEGGEGGVVITVFPVSECGGCEAWSDAPLFAPTSADFDGGTPRADIGNRAGRGSDWTPQPVRSANICTDPQHYVAWLCAWQGYPQP